MIEKLHIELTVPKEWTGKQAKIVWEFYDSIMEAIWEVHGDEIIEACEEEQKCFSDCTNSKLSKKIDDYPF